MRINSIPNKFEIFQEYYLMTKGKQISYNEALNLYFALDDTEKNEFAKYYRDETGYEIIDENGYDLGENVRYDEKTKTSNLNLISKHNLKIKYTLDAYAKKQGLTLDPQWAGYSAEEIINMENSGVNIPKEVLDIAHSIYESTGANYIAGSDEDNGTTEKEPFLELMPKAAKKIVEFLAQQGEKNVRLMDLARDDMHEAVSESFKYDKMILLASSYNMSVFPPMQTFLNTLKAKNYQNRKVGIVENGSWAPSAGKCMKASLEEMKDIKIIEPMITIKSAMKKENEKELEELAKKLLNA